MVLREHEGTVPPRLATLDAVTLTTSLTRGQQELIQLLRKIRIKCDRYGFFSTPVDPLLMGCPDYFDVVSRDDVMDLGTMETLIRSSQISNLDEFEACIRRIIDCSRLYNTDLTNVVRIETENLADKYKAIVERSRRQIEQALRSGQPRVKKRNDENVALSPKHQRKRKKDSDQWILINDDSLYGDSSSGDNDDDDDLSSASDGSSSCSDTPNSTQSEGDEEDIISCDSSVSGDYEWSNAAIMGVRSSRRKRKRLVRLMDVQAEESRLNLGRKAIRNQQQHEKDLEQINKLRKERESCLIMVPGMDTPIRVRLGECYKEGDMTMLRVDVFGDSDKQYYMTLAEITASIAKVKQMGFDEVDRFDGHRKVNGVNYIRVVWSNGSSTWQDMQQLRDDDPYGLAKWAKAKGLADNQDFQWIRELPDLKNEAPQYEVDSYNDHKIEEGILYVQVKWGNDSEVTWEPLNNLIEDDPEGIRQWLTEKNMNHHPLVQQANPVNKEVDVRFHSDRRCDQQASSIISPANTSNEISRMISSSSSERNNCGNTDDNGSKYSSGAIEQVGVQSEQANAQNYCSLLHSTKSVHTDDFGEECAQSGETKTSSTSIVSNGEYIIQGRGEACTLRWCWVQW